MPTGPYLVSSIAPITGVNAGFRVRGTPVAYPGFQRGGHLRSGPIRKVGGGGGGGGPVHFRSDIRKVGGGGAIRFGSDTKSRGGGGGGGHSASGPIPLFGTQIIYTCTYLCAT